MQKKITSSEMQNAQKITSSEMLVRGDMTGVGKVLPDFLKLCCRLQSGWLCYQDPCRRWNTTTTITTTTKLYCQLWVVKSGWQSKKRALSQPWVSGRVRRVEISEGGKETIRRKAHLTHSPWLSSLWKWLQMTKFWIIKNWSYLWTCPWKWYISLSEGGE